MNKVIQSLGWVLLIALIVFHQPLIRAEGSPQMDDRELSLLLEEMDEELRSLIGEWGISMREIEKWYLPRRLEKQGGEVLIWEERRLRIELDHQKELSAFETMIAEGLNNLPGRILDSEEQLIDSERVLIYRIGFEDTEARGEDCEIRTHELVIRSRFFIPGQRGKMALVIDDIGFMSEGFLEMLELPRPITGAVLPDRPFSIKQIEMLREQGIPYLLHLPMEPDSKKADPGTGVILVDHSNDEIAGILAENLDLVPGAVGVNNHMGSRATRNRRVMEVVLTELDQRGLFFLDSSTTDFAVSPALGRELEMPVLVNNFFIDNHKDLDYIKNQLKLLTSVAVRRGQAIGIGHVHPETMQAIKEMIPEIEAQGIELVFLCEMLPSELPKAKR